MTIILSNVIISTECNYLTIINHNINGGEIYMAYEISSDCISCGACESECPVDAISQGDTQYVIDAATCIDCAACVDVCPVDAISPA